MNNTRRLKLLGAAALTLGLLAGCTGDPKPSETTGSPTRWGLDEDLGAKNRVKDAPQGVRPEGRYDPRSCVGFSGTLRSKNDTFTGPALNERQEYGAYEVGGLNVRYIVLWTDYLDDSKADLTEALVGDIDECVTSPAYIEYRDLIGYPSLIRLGSVDSDRFGWHESTVKPIGWQEHGTTHIEEWMWDSLDYRKATGPYQATGLYTFVDDWIIVGIEAKTTDTTIDLAKELDLDTLLDHLAAKVKADPLTHHDYDHRKDYP